MMHGTKVPVLMFHSVGRAIPGWVWSFLTIPLELFIDQIEAIRRGFHSLHLSDVCEMVAEGRPIPENAVVLTFDDGYLDNWVYAYPLLKQRDIKATIFVSPEFVDPATDLRPNLDDVWSGRVRETEIDGTGFLSWNEMREMERSGLIEIQSHAMSHTWYFSEPRIVDFRHPGDEYVWMDWNDAPAEKYRYLGALWRPNVRYGEPVYAHRKSLAGRRILPSPEIGERLIEHVAERGGATFFEHAGWRDALFDLTTELMPPQGVEHTREDTDSFRTRLEYEIAESKRVIERELEKEVRILCWPGGGLCQESVELASEHYAAVTMPSAWTGTEEIASHSDLLFIPRIGTPIIERAGAVHYMSGRYLHHELKEYAGSTLHRRYRQVLKLLALVRLLAFERAA